MSDLYQETLDVVLAHLRAQGKRALFWEAPPSVAICAYHTSDGLMCAIGVLMEPSLATTLTGTVRWLAVRQALKPQYYPLGETKERPMNESPGPFMGLYLLISQAVAIYQWLVPSYLLFLDGQFGACLVYFLFIGPVISQLCGLLWPIYLIYLVSA